MKNGTAKRIISALIAAAVFFAMLPSMSLFAAADSLGTAAVTLDSTGNSVFDAFINDPRFTNGVTWTVDQDPLISPYSCGGCAAYCADFLKFCYGYNNPRAGTAFYDINETRAGDILTIGDQSDGTGHWLICLKRDGNNLYVAEANYRKKVRIGWNYSISGGKLVGTSRKFSMGYHHTGSTVEFLTPTVSVSVGTNGEFDVTWNDTGAQNYYVDIFNVALQTTVAGTGAYVGRSFSMHYSLPASGSYIASVTAIYENGVSIKGTYSFSLTVPIAPTVYAIVGNKGDVEVRWNNTYATRYYVYLFDVATQAEVPGTGSYNGSFVARWQLAASGDYIACVVAMYDGGINMSATAEFSIMVPTAPILSVAIEDDGEVEVSWNETEASRYYVYITDTAVQQPVSGTGRFLNGSSMRCRLTPGGSYAACVIAMYDSGVNMQSTIAFSLENPAEFDVSVEVGDNGAIDVSWNDVLATNYRVCILDSATQEPVDGTDVLVENGFTANYELPSGAYTAVVTAMYENKVNLRSSCSFAFLLAHEHDYEMKETVSPTLEAEGYRTYVCTICGDEYTEILPKLLRGDPDGDGDITVADALGALRVAARLTEATPELIACCDTDGDEAVTVADALIILRVAAKLADKL